MGKVNLIIDGKAIVADESKTVLEAALDNGIYIPHLCHHDDLHPNGGCRLCVVKQDGVDGVITSCSTKVKEGMVITTKDETAEKVRKLSVDLMFKTHPSECVGCPKYGKCQLASISQYVGDSGRDLRQQKLPLIENEENPLMLHEMYRCILCGRCVRACSELRGVGALKFEKVDGRMKVVINGKSLEDAGCQFCGACVEVCPTGSIRDKVGVFKDDPGLSREMTLVPCSEGCPAHINVPKYIRFIKEGNFPAAAATVREKAPFPESLGYICVHSCELQCKRNHLDGPLSIRNLKRFAASQDDGSWKANAFMKESTGKKVAVIGAGPAGLTAGYYLKKLGHEVTIFEKLPLAGGQMRYGIPSYRLPREVLDREIAEIESIGVEIKCDQDVKSAAELKAQGYDAVFVSVGTHAGNRLPLEGNDLPGVYLNADFLRSINLGKPFEVGENVVVLGGGNVAIDCAESALRLGAKHVVMTCLEAPDKMTASEEEVTWAKEDGIIVENSRTFDAIESENGKVTGLTVTGIEGLKFGPKGPEFTRIPDSTVTFPADTVIFAVGQHPDITEDFGLELNRGRIVTNDGHKTSVEGIYAAGDAVTGTRSVIAAIAEAREAVSEIDKFLGGDGNIEEKLAPEQIANPCIGKNESLTKTHRNEPTVTEVDSRKCNFEPMDLGFDCSKAGCEASRCLQCDLRVQISPQKFWSDFLAEEGGQQ
ncbi:FAD-dependent oxidoreductase [Pseudobutyrivibrio sp.]|uniref:FAD-dependent oxidoreductase n=1 Tax=Pseudobutyrivibrio sp. TaxID=2014367 RepID=UPI00386C5036